MTAELKDIVEKSYQVFKKYKATEPLEVCTYCCMTKNQVSDLVSLAVRHIPFDLLYDYNTAAKTEKPGIQEFIHFLPRFLELTADNMFLHHSVELVLSRFDYYDKDEWTHEEQDLMQNFGRAYFHQCLSIYPIPESEQIESVLIMLWKSKIDIKPILADWTTRTNKESVLHFNELILWSFKDNKPDELSNPFADKELSELVAEWLDRQEVKDKFAGQIEGIILEPPTDIEDRILNQLSWTYEKVKQGFPFRSTL